MKKTIPVIIFIVILMAFTVSYASLENETGHYAIVLELPEKKIIPEFKLPKFVEIIEEEAFEGTAIVKIELPSTVTTIGDRAFANISTLRSITIPRATNKIAATAFAGSSQVTIHAAPNSYARKYARTFGMPFSPVASFCAVTQGTQSVTISANKNKNSSLEADSDTMKLPEKQWHKLDEISVVGTLDIIFNEIKGRGPPMA